MNVNDRVDLLDAKKQHHHLKRQQATTNQYCHTVLEKLVYSDKKQWILTNHGIRQYTTTIHFPRSQVCRHPSMYVRAWNWYLQSRARWASAAQGEASKSFLGSGTLDVLWSNENGRLDSSTSFPCIVLAGDLLWYHWKRPWTFPGGSGKGCFYAVRRFTRHFSRYQALSTLASAFPYLWNIRLQLEGFAHTQLETPTLAT